MKLNVIVDGEEQILENVDRFEKADGTVIVDFYVGNSVEVDDVVKAR